jgi:hypothetical protein
MPGMSEERALPPGPAPRGAVPADPRLATDLRRMALHLETAAVLDLRAGRASDPVQAGVLRRRAAQRRAEAARIRARLSARGLALPAPSSPRS